jgi:hypothetical protein
MSCGITRVVVFSGVSKKKIAKLPETSLVQFGRFSLCISRPRSHEQSAPLAIARLEHIRHRAQLSTVTPVNGNSPRKMRLPSIRLSGSIRLTIFIRLTFSVSLLQFLESGTGGASAKSTNSGPSGAANSTLVLAERSAEVCSRNGPQNDSLSLICM